MADRLAWFMSTSLHLWVSLPRSSRWQRLHPCTFYRAASICPVTDYREPVLQLLTDSTTGVCLPKMAAVPRLPHWVVVCIRLAGSICQYSVLVSSGTLIQGLLVFNYSVSADYVYIFERWHGTLLIIAIASVGTLVNTWRASFYAFIFFGFIAVLVSIWVLSPSQAPSQAVWSEFTNSGGWSSMGLACLVGQLTPIVFWTGPDAATHMG